MVEESLSLRQALGDQWGLAASLGSLGWIALLQRDYDRMRSRLGESIDLRLEIGERGGLAWCLEKLAEGLLLQAQTLPVVRRRRESARAVRILSAAAALRRAWNAMIDPADQASYAAGLSGLRDLLGEPAFTAAWSAGEAASLESIIELAREAPPGASPGDGLTANQAARVQYGGLSHREREVAALIAQGKTNSEIAARMVVRTRTVETYVTRILNKLGYSSRVQIAAWALEAGLQPSDREAS